MIKSITVFFLHPEGRLNMRSPLGGIQRCILLHYHFKMQNYLSELYREPGVASAPAPTVTEATAS